MVWETRPRDSEVRRGEVESELRSDGQAETRPTKAGYRGEDQDVVGQSLNLDSGSYTVIGCCQRTFAMRESP